ncbi:hypothetical protein DDZ14_12255 [Maritimibacter sp. 55A14]|uniref:OmpA family protein n=1 Tax=Maritimibacter sp. 55A14 TaxID=2174844 RepID=UPI000D61D94B|nr:OmpA family protein [Maritimibacter sp. 55A14]PWE31985.1 hypothetical protein DDZ14_12255 [Maritimibacter sp. 55A14]
MRRTHILVATVATAALLAGCSDTAQVSFLEREAGSDVDEGSFGNPTMNNYLVMTGQKNAMIDLSRRFSEEVPSTITFAFDSAQLDETARANLREQANWIRQFPEVRFRVYGHTDLVGSETYNKRLGLRRAQAAVAYLSAQGVSRSRLEAVASFGETQPLIVSEGRERRNRRTVTDVSGFVKARKNELDGKYAELVYRTYTEGETISDQAETIEAQE